MRRRITLATAVLMTVGGTGTVLSMCTGSTVNQWLDPFSQQFADYDGGLINPFTDSAGYAGFSMPTNTARLNDWANSMTVSYNSPALSGWPTYDVPSTTDWASSTPDQSPDKYGAANSDPIGAVIAWRVP